MNVDLQQVMQRFGIVGRNPSFLRAIETAVQVAPCLLYTSSDRLVILVEIDRIALTLAHLARAIESWHLDRLRHSGPRCV